MQSTIDLLRWQLLELNIADDALMAKRDIALVVRENLHVGELSDDQLWNLDERLGVLDWEIENIDRRISDVCSQMDAAWRQTAPLRDQIEAFYPGLSAHEQAYLALSDYICSMDAVEFSQYDQFNAEDISLEALWEQRTHAQSLMLYALNRLDDASIESLLVRYQAREHDGSSFAVTSLDEVRSHIAAA